jgi:hypothetical protein
VLAPSCKVRDLAHPEAAVGYDEDFMLQLYRELGMETRVLYGSWCGRAEFVSYQDVILGTRPA